MTHRIITTLDTADERYALERLADLIAEWPQATLQEAERNWSVELPDDTAGAILRDVIERLDKGGFLP